MTPHQIATKIVHNWGADRDVFSTTEIVANLTPVIAAFDELLDLIVSDATFENRDTERYKYEAIVDDVINRACKALNPKTPDGD